MEPKFIHESIGVHTGWHYRLTAILPGDAYSGDFRDVYIPPEAISIKKLKSGYSQSGVGFPSAPALTLELDLDLISGNDDYDALVKACAATYNKIYMLSTVHCGVILTLECNFLGITDGSVFYQIFKGIARQDSAYEYSSDVNSLSITATGIAKCVIDSALIYFMRPNNEVGVFSHSVEVWNVAGRYSQMPHIFACESSSNIKAYSISDCDLKLSESFQAISRFLTRTSDEYSNYYMPLPKLYKQDYQDISGHGAELSRSEICLIGKNGETGALFSQGKNDQSCLSVRYKDSTVYDFFNDLAEWAFKKCDFDDGTAVNWYDVNKEFETVVTPDIGILDYAKPKQKGSQIGKIHGTAIEKFESGNYKDKDEYSYNETNVRDSQEFSWKLVFSNYPAAVDYHQEKNPFPGTAIYVGNDLWWRSDKMPRIAGLYYIEQPLLGLSNCLLRCSEQIKFNDNQNTVRSYTVNENDEVNEIYTGYIYNNWYCKDPSGFWGDPRGAITNLQAHAGHANALNYEYFSAFGNSLPKVEFSIDFDDAVIFDNSANKVNFLAKSLTCLWDLSNSGLDSRIDYYSGKWTPISYELDFETEKSIINCDKLR